MDENQTEIPDKVAQHLTDDEIENIRERRGWAIGRVIEIRDDEIVETTHDCIIELFNGEGIAGEFGGVRFMGVRDDDYIEGYAYPSYDEYEQTDETNSWVVEFTDPVDPDVGQRMPGAHL